MVGKVGFEPTQPMAPDLQSGVTLQLHRLPKTGWGAWIRTTISRIKTCCPAVRRLLKNKKQDEITGFARSRHPMEATHYCLPHPAKKLLPPAGGNCSAILHLPPASHHREIIVLPTTVRLDGRFLWASLTHLYCYSKLLPNHPHLSRCFSSSGSD